MYLSVTVHILFLLHLTPENDTRLKIIGDASDFNTNMVWILKGETIKKLFFFLNLNCSLFFMG